METSQRRHIVMGIRVNAAEQKSLRELAAAERANVSDFLRRRIGLADGPEATAPDTGQGRRERRA